MSQKDLDGRGAQANGWLKSANMGVSVARQGDRYLRTTFSPKPDRDKTAPYQQRLALGIHANPLYQN